jgi:hypothetical protein
MTTCREVFVLDNGACTAKVGVSTSEYPRYVTLQISLMAWGQGGRRAFCPGSNLKGCRNSCIGI